MQTIAELASAALAGGCDSPVRSGWAVGGTPFIQSRGDGAYAFDENGERYIDYIMGYGPLLFGYNHPALTRDLDDLASRGVLYGSTHPEEVRLAERIRARIPSMERIRFTTTGSEAMMSAVRVARAFTQRDLILRFAGNYHGHFDAALFAAGASAKTAHARRSGIPAGVQRDVAVARYNDLESVDDALRGREDEIAAILVEPVAANMGLVLPVPGFLEGLRERADRSGALLIFDEIITWLRFRHREFDCHPEVSKDRERSERPRAESRGVQPDITAIGKILGGGFPIAAFGGREDVMTMLAPDGPVFTGGTHAGNPFAVGMAHRVLDLLEAYPECYENTDRLAKRLATGIRSIFERRSLPYAVVQHESAVDFKFRAGAPNRNYDDALLADSARYAAYYHEMRRRKILLPPSQNEVMFLSTAHTVADVDETLTAIDESLLSS
ncbi:MAG TPA: aspartate aminotransferase family protein [Candidatus Rubrimentiphilum sp.]|nr:aspartate aminotransferase family protein [Candidatus Rubrimentiphilum sp.]